MQTDRKQHKIGFQGDRAPGPTAPNGGLSYTAARHAPISASCEFNEYSPARSQGLYLEMNMATASTAARPITGVATETGRASVLYPRMRGGGGDPMFRRHFLSHERQNWLLADFY
jgi:hypothetical protein